MKHLAIALALLLGVTGAAEARGHGHRYHRSAKATRTFQATHPCPSTGWTKPTRVGGHTIICPGYVIDHVWPLCAGGADDPANMQWQTVAAAERKDVWEHRVCAERRR
jgi:hypothetical protein